MTTQEVTDSLATKGALQFPDGAQKPYAVSRSDDGMEIGWQGSIYRDSDTPDIWKVTLWAGQCTARVYVKVDGPGWMREIEGTLREVLRNQSGVNVHVAVEWTTTMIA